jgi:glyceraldehyde 3-phosphate dehydrogenase
MTTIGINGFGRIGRLIFRAIVEQDLLGKDLEVVALNDLVPADNLAYLLKYDSTQGVFPGEVTSEKSRPYLADDDTLVFNGHSIMCLAVRHGPSALPWGKLGCKIVIESTGLFTDATMAKGHLVAGSRKVIISAPAKNEDITIVMGVNHQKYNSSNHHIISNGSCTTNCLAPVVHVLLKEGLWYRRRIDHDCSQLHSDAEDSGWSFAKGLERRAGCVGQHYSVDDRCCQSGGVGHPRAKGQTHRYVFPRTDSHGFRR